MFKTKLIYKKKETICLNLSLYGSRMPVVNKSLMMYEVDLRGRPIVYNSSLPIIAKMDDCKVALKEWERTHFSHINTKIRILTKELEVLQRQDLDYNSITR